MGNARMVLEAARKDELVEMESYLLVKDEDGKRDWVTAVWKGKGWALSHGKDLDSDWPDAVFKNPGKALVTDSATLDEHQAWAKTHAFYQGADGDLTYPALGLCGEAGEFAEKVKKSVRDDGGTVTEERKADMVKELGDVLFYLCMAAWKLDVRLSDVAAENVRKLEGRRARGALRGSGDNR